MWTKKGEREFENETMRVGGCETRSLWKYLSTIWIRCIVYCSYCTHCFIYTRIQEFKSAFISVNLIIQIILNIAKNQKPQRKSIFVTRQEKKRTSIQRLQSKTEKVVSFKYLYSKVFERWTKQNDLFMKSGYVPRCQVELKWQIL